VPEQLLTILKLCLLALLYLFFLRVLRAVWTEVNPPKFPAPEGVGAPTSAQPAAPRAPKAPKVPTTRKKAAAVPTVLVATSPPGRAGSQWSLAQELVAGRHAGCSVVLDEQYVSQQHAKFFVRGRRRPRVHQRHARQRQQDRRGHRAARRRRHQRGRYADPLRGFV